MPDSADRAASSGPSRRSTRRSAQPGTAGVPATSRRLADPGPEGPEAALNASEERFRAILESHPSAVVLVGPDGRISYANERTSELLGYDRDELTGMPVDRLVPEGVRRGHAADRNGYVEAPTTRQMGLGRDMSIRRKDGRLVPVEIGLSSFLSHGERYVVALVADITARKAAETALRSTSANLEALIAASPLATMTLDMDGRVLLWNPAAERMFGWTAREVVDHILPHVPAAELSETREIIRRVAEGEVIAGMELSRRRKDGHAIAVELYAAPQRDGDGRILGVIEQMADITGRRQLEEALLQTQKMESIGRLAGGIAHDFNNMLTAISGFAQLLIQDLPEGSLESENAEAINRAARQAAALTTQLLAFSRRQVLQPVVLDADSAIADMEPMLRRLIGEDVELRFGLSAANGRVRADPAQLEQVVMNLAINARDAMPHGGRLAIETSRATFDSAYALEHFAVSPGHYVVVAVSDSGLGMDRATKAHIFEPFFTTKEMGKGTGLGLATVYGIVRQSGGHIWLYSEPGEGTTFKVYLPLVEEDVAERADAPVEIPGGSETILVVEDEESVRKLATHILERRGYRVLSASNPREALGLVESHPGTIDLLVSDVVMPVLSGPELARRIRSLRPEIRTLFLSGYTEELVNAEGRLAGMDGFLSKPFTADDLALKVGEIIGATRARRA
jgi:two-component system, cell cycle sensor histidine kinase and response regulator CckA